MAKGRSDRYGSRGWSGPSNRFRRGRQDTSEKRQSSPRLAVDGIEPETSSRREKARPRRNKLVYKNRWLISVNVVAALRRAGIDCDIVLPEALPDTFLPDDVRPGRERSPLAVKADGDEIECEAPPAGRLH